MRYISPYQVVSAIVTENDDLQATQIDFVMTDGTTHRVTGNLAHNASRVFQGIGIVASIAEDAVTGREDAIEK